MFGKAPSALNIALVPSSGGVDVLTKQHVQQVFHIAQSVTNVRTASNVGLDSICYRLFNTGVELDTNATIAQPLGGVFPNPCVTASITSLWFDEPALLNRETDASVKLRTSQALPLGH